MSFTAGFKEESLVQFRTAGDPLRLAVSKTIRTSVVRLDQEIQKLVKSKFFFKGNILNLRELSFERSGKYGTGAKIYSATLGYHYKPVPMTEYPIQLVDTGYTNKTAKHVFVRIRKRVGGKMVYGKSLSRSEYGSGDVRAPYMGFSQKGMIFERNQGATWENGQRLPIHALYSPSFTDLLHSPELTHYFESSEPLQKIESLLSQELSRAT
jgi:hypothetical protein